MSNGPIPIWFGCLLAWHNELHDWIQYLKKIWVFIWVARNRLPKFVKGGNYQNYRKVKLEDTYEYIYILGSVYDKFWRRGENQN